VKSIRMNIPKALILFQLIRALIPVILAYFIGDAAKTTILGLMHIGLISNILDGIISRKLRSSRTQLRRMAHQTDMVYCFL
jgi:phosphatidylglycerophosphate synthase